MTHHVLSRRKLLITSAAVGGGLVLREGDGRLREAHHLKCGVEKFSGVDDACDLDGKGIEDFGVARLLGAGGDGPASDRETPLDSEGHGSHGVSSVHGAASGKIDIVPLEANVGCMAGPRSERPHLPTQRREGVADHPSRSRMKEFNDDYR